VFRPDTNIAKAVPTRSLHAFFGGEAEFGIEARGGTDQAAQEFRHGILRVAALSPLRQIGSVNPPRWASAGLSCSAHCGRWSNYRAARLKGYPRFFQGGLHSGCGIGDGCSLSSLKVSHCRGPDICPLREVRL